jgi:riboflavin synthase
MFTGLVEAVGEVSTRREKAELVELTIESELIAAALAIGDSVANAGVCLTATKVDGARFSLDVAPETLRRTTLGALSPGDRVNLELPLKAADRLGGHFVQGHVDEVGRVVFAGDRDGDYVLRVEHKSEGDPLVVEKGSVALHGVSLTVTGCSAGWLEVMLIPHTLDVTTLGALAPGHGVHIEYDILAKYVARFSEPYLARGLIEE